MEIVSVRLRILMRLLQRVHDLLVPTAKERTVDHLGHPSCQGTTHMQQVFLVIKTHDHKSVIDQCGLSTLRTMAITPPV